MVDWCIEHYPPQENSLHTLEIGSGNGTLLFGLLEAGYSKGTLKGIDYSADAIKLSQAIAKSRDMTDGITFQLCDFLEEELEGGWDLILDKGTYDAMALGKKGEDGHAPNARYPERVARLLKPGGRFLITCEIHVELSSGLR